ncbi:unnamed protein product [Protopolystoma xenopodis]|uniref:F-box domain-containing protein n=1 Tax=Protopolystoma xenopodis TaxID=117903 RepID=A0A448WXK1_9PLAT|nr:unnamed protein product [Protopolystoma xenopodis]
MEFWRTESLVSASLVSRAWLHASRHPELYRRLCLLPKWCLPRGPQAFPRRVSLPFTTNTEHTSAITVSSHLHPLQLQYQRLFSVGENKQLPNSSPIRYSEASKEHSLASDYGMNVLSVHFVKLSLFF